MFTGESFITGREAGAVVRKGGRVVVGFVVVGLVGEVIHVDGIRVRSVGTAFGLSRTPESFGLLLTDCVDVDEDDGTSALISTLSGTN